MLGNWATGRLRIVMAPTSTMRIAITIATMGRLMKNFDMGLPILCGRAKRLGAHLRARAYFLNSFGDHSFARIQPFSNDPLGADAVAHLDCPNADFVLAPHNRNLVTALELCHRALRHKKCTLLQPDNRANFSIAARPQNVPRIGKQSGDPNCPGPHIDLTVCKVERTFVRINGGVRQYQLQAETLVRL